MLQKIRTTIYTQTEIYEQLRQLAFENRISVNNIYNQAVRFFLKNLEEKKVEIEK